jgi:alcohol dehydrogenase class IV
VETLRDAVKFTRDGKFDVVVGIGGGAVIDTAKACAIMVTNRGDIKDYAATVESAWEDKVKTKGIPLIVSPTTSGTGSENTGGIMIIDGDYKTWIGSAYAYPDVAIVDPALTLTLPPKMTSGSGMDALSHAVEAYMLVAMSNPWIDAFALEATRLTAENLRTAYHDGKNLQARFNMSWAAHLGGWVAMATSGPATMGHCLSEALGSKYKIPHGTMCGICLPYAMDFNLPAIIPRLVNVASAMGEDVTGMRPRDAAESAVRAVVDLMKDTDTPISMKPFKAPKSDIPKLAEYVVKDRQYMYYLPRVHPRKLTLENVTELLENIWEGKLEEN